MDSLQPIQTWKRQPSRRVACDRCRHQKLKCARQDKSRKPSKSGKCNRCAKHGFHCSFTVSKSPSPRPVSHSSSSAAVKGTASAQSSCCFVSFENDYSDGRTQNQSKDSYGGEPGVCGCRGAGGMVTAVNGTETFGQASFTHGLARGETDLQSTSTLLHGDLNALRTEHAAAPTSSGFLLSDLNGFSSTGVDPFNLDPINLDHINLDPINLDPINSDPLNLDPISSDPINLDPISFSNSVEGEHVNFEHFNYYGFPPSHSSSAVTDTTASTATFGNSMQGSGQVHNYNSLAPSQFFGDGASASMSSSGSLKLQVDNGLQDVRESQSISFSRGPTASGFHYSDNESEMGSSSTILKLQSLPSKEAQQRSMQQLSELSINLFYLLINGNVQGHGNSTALFSQFVEEILQSSANFLAILKSISLLTPSNFLSSSPSLQQSSTSDDAAFSTSHTNCSPSIASESSNASPIMEDAQRHCQQIHRDKIKPTSITDSVQTNGRKSNNDDSASNAILRSFSADVDMITIIQLLTCYIRIVHLHGILYSKLCAHQEGLPSVCPIIRIGGFKLDGFGTFQTKLLLQISTHVLNEIEMILGLPDGYRISKKDLQVRGILENSVSVKFVDLTMRESERTTGFGVERCRIASVRNNIARLQERLKSTNGL